MNSTLPKQPACVTKNTGSGLRSHGDVLSFSSYFVFDHCVSKHVEISLFFNSISHFQTEIYKHFVCVKVKINNLVFVP